MTGHHTARCLADIGSLLYAWLFIQLALIFVPLGIIKTVAAIAATACFNLYVYFSIKHAIACDTADAVAKKLKETL